MAGENHLEKTLVLLKPDAVQRGLMGRIIQRFEDVGLRICAMKMMTPSEEQSLKHYTEDIAERRGQHVRDALVKMLANQPILAIAVEGIDAIALVRKIVGATQSSDAAPGTIRGDFSHQTFSFCDDVEVAMYNLIHASADKDDAAYELPVWFEESELLTWDRSDKAFTTN